MSYRWEKLIILLLCKTDGMRNIQILLKQHSLALLLLFCGFDAFSACPPSWNSNNTVTVGDSPCVVNGNQQFFNLLNARTLTIANGASLTINGNFQVWDNVVVNGTLTVSGTLSVAATASLNIASTGTVNATNFTNGGAFTGTAIVNGILNVSGTFTNNGTGTIQGSGILNANVTDNGASTFSGTYNGTCTGNCDGVLPVTYLSFKGTKSDVDNCLLEWSTASEVVNMGFFVEKLDISAIRAEERQDTQFKVIGFVEGNGTTVKTHYYQFVDEDCGEEVYYRLRQVDYDGTEELSHVVSITSARQNKFDAFTVYPNPSNGDVRIGGIGSGNDYFQFRLYDIAGHLLMVNTAMSLEHLSNLVSEALRDQPPGILLLSVSDGKSSHSTRIIKQ